MAYLPKSTITSSISNLGYFGFSCIESVYFIILNFTIVMQKYNRIINKIK